MNVLITSASRKVPLVKAFQAALSVTGGGRVVAGDISALSPALYVADDGVLLPKSDSDGFLDEVLDVCKHHNVGVIVPTRDEELMLFAQAAEEFLDVGVMVAVSAVDA